MNDIPTSQAAFRITIEQDDAVMFGYIEDPAAPVGTANDDQRVLVGTLHAAPYGFSQEVRDLFLTLLSTAGVRMAELAFQAKVAATTPKAAPKRNQVVTFAAAWAEFEQHALANAPRELRRLYRRTFYAGAIHLMRFILENADEQAAGLLLHRSFIDAVTKEVFDTGTGIEAEDAP